MMERVMKKVTDRVINSDAKSIEKKNAKTNLYCGRAKSY